MNRMIAITIRPGATTAAARLICPLPCSIPPPAATSTSANVPSSSENSRRHSRRGSSKSWRSPNSSWRRWWARGTNGLTGGSSSRAGGRGASVMAAPAVALRRADHGSGARASPRSDEAGRLGWRRPDASSCMDVIADLRQGRDAHARNAWTETEEAFARRRRRAAARPATTSCSGPPPPTCSAATRTTFGRSSAPTTPTSRRGEPLRAACCAIWLGMHLLTSGEVGPRRRVARPRAAPASSGTDATASSAATC